MVAYLGLILILNTSAIMINKFYFVIIIYNSNELYISSFTNKKFIFNYNIKYT